MGIIGWRQVGIVKKRDGLVLEGCVNGTTLVVFTYCLDVFVQDVIFFCWRCPLCNGGGVAWVKCMFELRSHDPGVLAQWEEEVKVAALSPSKCTLHQHRVCR